MGRMTYDGVVSVDFDDRVLAHLQLVIGNKMRRGESFHFTWRDDLATGDGRTIVWMHPRISIVYKFWGSKTPDINRAWVDALMTTANSAAGLHVVPEPEQAVGLAG
jgi:hypothetical protein